MRSPRRIGFVLILSLMLLFVASTQAEERTVVCYVTHAGPAWGSIYIRLKDASYPESFTEKWFIPQPGQEREMLATGLASMANGNKVVCVVDVDLEYSNIKAMFMLK